MSSQSTYHDSNHVPVLAAVSSSDGQSVVLLWADPVTHRLLVTSTGGSGSGYQVPLTGGLTGTNTWTTAPNVIVVDGVPKQQTSTDGTVNWTGTTTTVLTVIPTFDIYSIA